MIGRGPLVVIFSTAAVLAFAMAGAATVARLVHTGALLSDRDLLAAVAGMLLSGAALAGILLWQGRRSRRLAGDAAAARQRAEEAEATLVEAIESASEGILLTDRDGRVVLANSRFRQAYPVIADLIEPGATFAELAWAGAALGQFAAEADPDRIVEHRQPPLADQQEPREQRLSDGRVLLVNDRRTPGGGMVSIRTDITAQKQAEALLQRRLAALEALPDGLAILDAAGCYTYLNHAHAVLYGYAAASELIGQHWSVLYEPAEAERIGRDLLPWIERQGRWRGEAAGRRRDGSTYPQEVALTALGDGGLICIVRDITDRKQAEAESERLREQFHQAQRMDAIGRLAGGIAHDFNNLLAAILGYASFLIEDLPEGSEQQSFARQVARAGERAKHLVQQILAFSRARSGARQTIDLTRVVTETAGMLRATLPSSVALTARVMDGPAMVEANPIEIGQVLTNLCVNARDAIGQGHGAIEIELSAIDLDGGGGGGDGGGGERTVPAGGDGTAIWVGGPDLPRRHVRLRVRDTGCGMAPAVMERMFEPFFTTRTVGKGSGLGLAAVHGIVQAHGGALRVESRVGAGTTFDVFLPAAAPPDAAGDEVAAAGTGGGGTILVVDDEDAVATMLARMLERMGYEAGCCASGREALEALDEAPGEWRLVITDQTMPEMTGYELAQAIRDRHPGVPVILCSGYSESVSDADIARAGIVAFLHKPVGPAALERSVRRALEAAADAAAAGAAAD